MKSSRFTYKSADELENGDLRGILATYGGGGYVQYLSKTDILEGMKSILVLEVH